MTTHTDHANEIRRLANQLAEGNIWYVEDALASIDTHTEALTVDFNALLAYAKAMESVYAAPFDLDLVPNREIAYQREKHKVAHLFTEETSS